MTERKIGVEGPMFSGKTLEIMRIAESLKYAGHDIQIFKPIIDDRGEGINQISSRFGGKWEATPIRHPFDLLEKLRVGVDVVIVDEVQFLNQKTKDGEFAIVKVFNHLSENNVRVIFAGLARDFRREPFGPMPQLLALAQDKTVLTAVCDELLENGRVCGQPATETQRFVDAEPADWNDPVILVGDKKEGYAARCIKHHKVKNMPSQVIFESDEHPNG